VSFSHTHKFPALFSTPYIADIEFIIRTGEKLNSYCSQRWNTSELCRLTNCCANGRNTDL